MGQDDLGAVLKEIFAKWQVALTPTQAPTLAHSFHKKLKKVLLPASTHHKVLNPAKSAIAKKSFWEGISFVHTPQNLLEIGKSLGIEIVRTPRFGFVRDHLIPLKAGLASIQASPHLKEATMRTHSSNIYLNRVASTHTANQFFNVWSGYTQSYQTDIYKTFATKTLSTAYLEGGNVFILPNQAGTIKALIGIDHLTQTFHLLQLEGKSWDVLAQQVALEFEKVKAKIKATLSTDRIKKVAEEMFAQGLLNQNGKSGLITHQNQLNLMLAKFYLEGHSETLPISDLLHQIAIQQGLLNFFEWHAQDEQKYAEEVSNYLAKLEITKALMAYDLEMAVEDLHFITQLNYHLDLFMTPGPGHSLFLLHYGFCADVLKAVQENVKLTEADANHLERYLLTAQKMDRELGGLLKQVEGELREAGFAVVPTPGNFLYESKTMYQEFPMPSGGFNINFMNTLTGESVKTNQPFYITHGLQVGDHLGSILMQAFEAFLKQYEPEITVYFIGYDPQNPNDFSEAMDWWNRLETQSGVHCTTLELEWTA